MTRTATNNDSLESGGIARADSSTLWHVAVYHILRISLGCLLLLSALTKLQSPYSFLATLDQYELVGPKLAVAVAAVLPFLELTVGACLITGFALRSTWILAVVLFAIFLFATTSVAYRGLRTTCGCFGTLEAADITWGTVVRCVAFLGAAITGMCLNAGGLGRIAAAPV